MSLTVQIIEYKNSIKLKKKVFDFFVKEKKDSNLLFSYQKRFWFVWKRKENIEKMIHLFFDVEIKKKETKDKRYVLLTFSNLILLSNKWGLFKWHKQWSISLRIIVNFIRNENSPVIARYEWSDLRRLDISIQKKIFIRFKSTMILKFEQFFLHQFDDRSFSS